MALPWNEVNAVESEEVAQILQMTPARERHKWACPVPPCESSDAFHTYRGASAGSFCWSCKRSFTNVDLTAAMRGTDAVDAVKWLADRLGISYLDDGARSGRAPYVPAAPAPRAPRVSPREAAMERLAKSPHAARPGAVYQALVDHLPLTLQGRTYLQGRGLVSAVAERYGFRSVDSMKEWAEVRRFLQETYAPDELTAAGFPVEKNRPWIPMGGLVPMLLIPFWKDEQLASLRFRTIGPPPKRLQDKVDAPRYVALKDATPDLPFAADAMKRSVVHVVEGELNAFTLMQPPYRLDAFGIPGAGVWQSTWAEKLALAFRVVTWYDEDDAGRAARERMEASCREVHGDGWADRKLRHMRLPKDPNDMHQDGALEAVVRAAPWLRQANDSLLLTPHVS